MLSVGTKSVNKSLHKRHFSASQRRNGNVLVYADHDGANLDKSVLSAVTAAGKFGDVHVAIAGAGDGVQGVAEQASKVAGVNTVHVAKNDMFKGQVAENVTPFLLSLHDKLKSTHILSAATTSAKGAMPRVAAKLDVAQVSEIVSVVDDSTFTRPIYAGNAVATVKSNDGVKVLTVRATAFDKADAEGNSAAIEQVEATEGPSGNVTFKSSELKKSDRPDLQTAGKIVSVGRGIKGAEHLPLIEKLADKLGAGIGASRAVCDAGWVPSDWQIGQTGKIVAPELYIALGISGAIQHLAGMNESKVIVAVNKDPDAPIFKVADFGIVADLFNVVPEMTEKL